VFNEEKTVAQVLVSIVMDSAKREQCLLQLWMKSFVKASYHQTTNSKKGPVRSGAGQMTQCRDCFGWFFSRLSRVCADKPRFHLGGAEPIPTLSSDPLHKSPKNVSERLCVNRPYS
jgi:hypothetical protein